MPHSILEIYLTVLNKLVNMPQNSETDSVKGLCGLYVTHMSMLGTGKIQQSPGTGIVA